ncbi:MAG: PIN domain-containing protein [Elusimicrobiota bacterium]|jgi:predicted nucleic acid-binding protein|nr:PIN domain-containing protein [Elusimicrobiota bacterium]
MKKLKIYLDTSVISYLQQNDAKEEMQYTHILWQDIKDGKYIVYISDITIFEIKRCYEPKRTSLEKYLEEIQYQLIQTDKEIDMVADKFIENHILSKQSYDDCRHIACSIVAGCDIIVSWNFKHIVNYKTIKGVRLVSLMTGYNDVSICSPEMLIERGKE